MSYGDQVGAAEASAEAAGNWRSMMARGGRVCRWIGGGDENRFRDPANWKDGVVPRNGDIAVFEADPAKGAK